MIYRCEHAQNHKLKLLFYNPGIFVAYILLGQLLTSLRNHINLMQLPASKVHVVLQDYQRHLYGVLATKSTYVRH